MSRNKNIVLFILIVILSAGLYLQYDENIELESKVEELEDKLTKESEQLDLVTSNYSKRNRELRTQLNNAKATLRDPQYIQDKYFQLFQDYAKNNNYTGKFELRYLSGDLFLKGRFSNGIESGIWKKSNRWGSLDSFKWVQYRVGARCCDGTRSSATGRGACSWHGGVCNWIVETYKYKLN